MNKYKRKIVKRLSKGPHAIEELVDIKCYAVVFECLKELEQEEIARHVTELYEVDSSQNPIGKKQKCDYWIITLKGMDAIAEMKREILWKSLPIAISICALIFTILKH